MSELIERVRRLRALFKQRSFVTDSPGVRPKRMKDGRVQIDAKQKGVPSPPSPPSPES
jgi:hypothetical protein